MKHLIILLSLGFLIGTPSFAQESYTITLKEAQEHALEHNRNLKNASLEIQKAEASQWKTIATMLPQASVNLDYSNFMGYEMNFGAMAIPMHPSGNLTAQVGLGLSGAQFVGLEISKIVTGMAEISLKKTEQQIVNNVKSIYFSILVMKQTTTLLEENLANMQKLLVFTENSVKVGVADQTNADQLMVQISTMETSINAVKRSLEMLYNSLRLQMGVEVEAEITLTQTIDDLLNVEKALQYIGTDFNIDNNYDYKLLKESGNLSKKQITLNQWSYGPTISGFYQYTNKTYFGKEEGFNMTPPNLIGAKITIPIFTSGVSYSKVREAKISYEIQQNTLADTEDALKIQHRQLRYDLTSAFESYETQKKNIEVNQRILKNISNKYEQGMASSLDVTTTGTNLITAQNSYVQALMELVTAQIALEKLLNIDNQ
ncbi:MAG: TolC family protein [Salinivirgaceae bacterium]|nr:TolC family protein [Salinivirgaceae bacterium]